MLLSALALALIAATAAAFAWTESLKLERLPVVGPRFPESFSPVCVCPTETAKLRLRFRVTDTVDADILDAEGEVVRSLGERRVRPGLVTFEWDGKNDEGRIVPDAPVPAACRARGQAADDRRSRTRSSSTRCRPRSSLCPANPDRLLPRRRQPRRRRPDRRTGPTDPPGRCCTSATSSRSRSRLVVRAARSIWDGKVDGTLLSPGTYRLTLRVRDPAGNLSPESERATVELRYITLSSRGLSRSARWRAQVRGRHRRPGVELAPPAAARRKAPQGGSRRRGSRRERDRPAQPKRSARRPVPAAGVPHRREPRSTCRGSTLRS